MQWKLICNLSFDANFFIYVGKYYVVDAGYPNRPGYLSPYKGERYHLPEWHRGMEPNTPKEKFNRIHSSVRNVIERSFGLLKMKWQILYKMPSFSMLTQKKVVAATMVIHNFIREHASGDVDFAKFEIRTLCQLSQKGTTSMLCLAMPLIHLLRNQAL